MSAEAEDKSIQEVFKLAPFNPSSEQIQEKAMELLRLNENDILFDLGCGDGRLLIAAAMKYPGLRCVGIEIDPKFAKRAADAVQQLPQNFRDKIDIREEDVLKQPMTSSQSKRDTVSDLTLMDDATALYLFVLPKGIIKIMPILEALVEKRKAEGRSFRVLSYMFKIHEWQPTVVDTTARGDLPIYLYEFK